jgi:hypothetical protein
VHISDVLPEVFLADKFVTDITIPFLDRRLSLQLNFGQPLLWMHALDVTSSII